MQEKDKEKDIVQLPDNAFRELEAGEEYKPVMDSEKVYPEVNTWSVAWGIIMAMLFYVNIFLHQNNNKQPPYT